jgi:DNA repair exonuclease SbcCD ATPase subunit
MIVFQTIRWKNLLSTGNTFTEVQLNKSPNTLIIGQNGAGKSTILDAICFALFGKPYRKINKPNLINTINEKETVTEIEFIIGKKSYKVIRGIKPNVFEIYCDGKLLNQDAKAKDYQDFLEKSILKFNFKSFTQIVILGSASFVPFMQLTSADRRTIIEDLLDIQIFSSMNLLIKEKLSEIKEGSTKNKYAMELISEKINLQKESLEEGLKIREAEIDKKFKEMEESNRQIQQLNRDNLLISKHIESLTNKISDSIKVQKKSSKLLQLESKLEAKLKKLDKEEKFYEENDGCPTCKQIIDDAFRSSQLSGINQTKREVGTAINDVEKQIKETNEKLEKIQEITKSIQEHNKELVKNQSTITAINKYINKTNEEMEQLRNRNVNTEEDNQKLKSLKLELSELIKKQEQLSIEKHYNDYAASLLKDNGIKAKIIKQYLPIINKLVNKYLKSMEFFVNFTLNENFEESIKSRHRDEFAYENFSEGEKMRIDLALLFTWRQIAKMKNSTNTNILLLDEVFDSSLDAVGTDEFMKLIHEMDHDTNIFVISHKNDQLFEKFRSVIRFEKKNNFSRISA